VLIGVLSSAVVGVFSPKDFSSVKFSTTLSSVASSPSVAKPTPPTESALADGVLTSRHVLRFGRELWTHHVLAIEAAGLLLFAALIGAAVIVGHGERSLRAKP
jgi:NADH:ubiquinone oxidoreductase subunit 6 (subunit J)